MLYDSLENALRMQARDDKEFSWFKEIVAEYFDGKMQFDDMPDTVKLCLAYWESEQEGGL